MGYYNADDVTVVLSSDSPTSQPRARSAHTDPEEAADAREQLEDDDGHYNVHALTVPINPDNDSDDGGD